MQSLNLLTFLFIVSGISAAAGDIEVIPLENGTNLRIEEITPSRIIPYAYYDQAVNSIPSMYPDAIIITKRRMGQFGEKTRLFYSLVGYKESKSAKEVIIGGNIRYKEKAWSFSATVPGKSYSDNLVLVLEHIADLARQAR